MSITSVKGIVFTGLAALTLVACGPDLPPWDGSTSGEGGAGGGGIERPPWVPETAYKWPVAWEFACYEIVGDLVIHGRIGSSPSYHEYYDVSHATLNVGDILQFFAYDIVQNMESGKYPLPDSKFSTYQGARRCLVFDRPGTYPFFSYGARNPMTGELRVK